MITAQYCATLARYNCWQNRSLVAAAETLDDAARKLPRGAFFGSIAATFSHLLWADLTWLSRLSGSPKPPGGIAESATLFPDWDEWLRERRATDMRIVEWADNLTEADLEGELFWYSGVLGRQVRRSKALCTVHFFNHQTHHRGQIHAMLTAAGTSPGDTDLVFMPEGLDPALE